MIDVVSSGERSLQTSVHCASMADDSRWASSAPQGPKGASSPSFLFPCAIAVCVCLVLVTFSYFFWGFGGGEKSDVACEVDEMEVKFRRWKVYECEMETAGKLTGFIDTGNHAVEIHLANNHDCGAHPDSEDIDSTILLSSSDGEADFDKTEVKLPLYKDTKTKHCVILDCDKGWFGGSCLATVKIQFRMEEATTPPPPPSGPKPTDP